MYWDGTSKTPKLDRKSASCGSLCLFPRTGEKMSIRLKMSSRSESRRSRWASSSIASGQHGRYATHDIRDYRIPKCDNCMIWGIPYHKQSSFVEICEEGCRLSLDPAIGPCRSPHQPQRRSLPRVASIVSGPHILRTRDPSSGIGDSTALFRRI